MRRQKITRPLSFLVLLFALGTVMGAFGQTKRYMRDGLSFTYPAEWPLSDESDATAQSLNLDRGLNEAKIIIVALRSQLNSRQLAEVQPKMTEAIVNGVAEEMAKLGAQAQRTAISETIGGLPAQGVRLRATLRGEIGDANIYWLHTGGRLVHVIFVGSDQECGRAAYAWNLVRNTLRVGTAPAPPPAQAAHKWANHQGAVDDSSGQLDQNIVLNGTTSRERILNGPLCRTAATPGAGVVIHDLERA